MLCVLMLGLAACGAGTGNNVANDFDWENTREPGNITQSVSHERKQQRNNAVTNNSDRNRPNQNHLRRNVDNNKNENPDISASFTTINSEKYPHTRAILVQDAQFSFTEMNPDDVANIKRKIESELKKKFGELTPQLQQQAQTMAERQIRQQTQHEHKQRQQHQAQQPAQQPKQNQAQQPAEQPQQKEAQQPAQQQPKPPANEETQATTGASQFAQQVIDLTNQERAKGGLPALKGDGQLSSVALKKSQDMQANNYFSHTSPTYGSPFDMMRDFGVSYKTAGENIAQGQRTPQEVVQAWMNSEGHRKNIISRDFTHIGVGHEPKGNHWTQMFIGK